MESDAGTLGMLPPTAWDAILQYMNLFQMKILRATSRGLKRLVDESPTFVNKCFGDIPYGTVLDRGYEPDTWVRVHQLRIKHCTVINVSAWWPRLADHLTYLYIDHSGFLLPALAEILRHTPNVATLGLHHLHLINPNDRAEKHANFRLTKLTYFSIGKVHEQIAELMWLVIAPNQLTNFGCVWNYEPDDDEQLIVDFLERSQGTMKYLGLSPTPDMLEQIGNFERFNPSAATLYCSRFQAKHVVNFTRKVTSLTRLTLEEIKLSDDILRKICSNLPNLKELNVCIVSTDTWKPSFLDVAPKLESLAVQHKSPDFVSFLSFESDRLTIVGDFAGCPRSPNLKEIILTGIVPKANLNDYLAQSPNLHSVTLDFQSENFSTLPLTVPLDKLENLTLRTLSIPALEETGVNRFPSLRRLTLVSVAIPTDVFHSLLSMFPALETIRILSIADDDDVRFMCENLPNLRNLELFQCPLTDASLGHVISYGLKLEKLHISSCCGVSEAAQRQLKALDRIWVQ
uniref:F-box domain-containing protein n=1 Tax=Culex tarsalis TaxID=7177 RepID=A0A1Q3F5J8_CULTA